MKPMPAASTLALILGVCSAAAIAFGSRAQAAPVVKPPAAPAFVPPPDSAIPDNDFGKEVKLGQSIFNDTGRVASAFVGNTLRCALRLASHDKAQSPSHRQTRATTTGHHRLS